MKKKVGRGIAIALAVYILLLYLLTVVESKYSSSGIKSFADALWYSLVTITTVGYGDLYPVSPAGRLIAVFFLMLSVGFLTAVFGAVYSLLTGRIWPGIYLKLKGNRKWFLFSEMNEASLSLAKNLEKQYPEAILIFCKAASEKGTSKNRLFVNTDIKDVLSQHENRKEMRTAFLISDDEIQNCNDAYALKDSPAMLYCRSREIRGMNDVSFFSDADICARRFWKEHPIQKEERKIFIIGDGRYAQALINNAIITNCRTPVYTAQYHLFGDWNIYRQTHFCLDQVMAVNREEEGKDSLFFHDAAWNADVDLILAADRIIFCFDNENENVQYAQMLDDCFAHDAKVYVRSSCSFVPGMRFGETGELYTEELVMKHRLDRLAMGLHNRYCSKTEKQMPTWEELSIFMKASNRAAADHVPTKISLLLDEVQSPDQERCRMAAKAFHEADDMLRDKCRQNEHDRWMRFHCLHNWRYASQRNDFRRMHPCILPYEQLSDEEKAKDDYAWQLLAECAEIQETL